MSLAVDFGVTQVVRRGEALPGRRLKSRLIARARALALQREGTGQPASRLRTLPRTLQVDANLGVHAVIPKAALDTSLPLVSSGHVAWRALASSTSVCAHCRLPRSEASAQCTHTCPAALLAPCLQPSKPRD